MKKLFNCTKFTAFTFAALFALCFFTVSCSNASGGSGSSSSVKFDSQLESDVLRELNLARTQPAVYANYLREYKSHISGYYYSPPGQIKIRLKEGTAAVEEAITALESQTPLLPLTLSKGMSLAARDHIKDTGPKGLTGHDGTDGSSPFQRINRYGTWSGGAGENIQYGKKDARGIVIQLIIDDGTPGRGHRTSIYNPSFKYVGIACGSHATYTSMCVQDFANNYTEN